MNEYILGIISGIGISYIIITIRNNIIIKKTKKIKEENNIIKEERDPSDILFIQHVIKLLENNPEKFTSRINGQLEKFVCNYHNDTYIHSDGEIFSPFKPKQTLEETTIILRLMKTIINRDKEELIKNLNL